MAVHLSTAADMKGHLHSLLDAKEKQLQQAGTLGQRVLAQQMELEERIRQLQELEQDRPDDEQLDDDARERYKELADTLIAWDAENAQLSSAFGKSSASPSIPVPELPREEPERQKPSTSTAAQSRRAKNAAHRADDVEFAFEIGSGLLNEVRRLQSLLGERDKAIQDMKEEKDDLEASVESLRKALRQQEQSADKFKEENWNLEVTLQDLRTQLSNYQSTASRLESETKRLTKLLSSSRDATESLKNENTSLQTSLEELTNKHETDIALARKHAAGLARDKSDMQQTIDTLKGEVARATRRWGGPNRYGSPLTPNGSDAGNNFLTPGTASIGGDDVFSNAASTNTRRGKMGDHSMMYADELDGLESDFPESPDASPLGPKKSPWLGPNHPINEIEALQQRLAHAQRQIATLKGTLQREKKEKMELRKRLPGAETEDGDGDVDWEGGDSEREGMGMDVDEDHSIGANTTLTSRRRGTPFKVGGRGGVRGRMRGRGRGRHSLGLSWSERVSMAQSDQENTRFSFEREMSPPPVPPVPSNLASLQGELEAVEDEQADHVPDDLDASPSTSASSKRASVASITSIDGLDPAYANHGMLKRTLSNSSVQNGTSPLRTLLLRRSASRRGAANSVGVSRRPRGGMAYQDGRPPSLIDTPEDLTFALGGSPMRNSISDADASRGIIEELTIGGELEEVVLVEVGVQAEPEPKPESEVQTVSQPTQEEPKKETMNMAIQHEAEPEPKPVLVDMSMQTEEPVRVQTDVAIQHEPMLVDSGIGTDPVPEKIQAEAQVQVDSEPKGIGMGMPAALGVPRERERTATITQRDVSNLSIGSDSSSAGDRTITDAPSRLFLSSLTNGDVSEGEETETGDEADYQDARQSVGLPSATASREDFHSIMTMTDNELSDMEDDGMETEEADDTESIKVSRLPRDDTRTTARESFSQSQRSSFYATPASSAAVLGLGLGSGDREVDVERVFDEKSVEVNLVEEPKAEPKPEVREVSVQTDEWIPTPQATTTGTNIVAPIPIPFPGQGSTSPVMYRVGTGHQFQFIPPPPTASTTSSSSVAPPATTAAPSVPSTFNPNAPTPSPSSSVFRENSNGFITIFPGGHHDRRQSMDSVVSSVLDDASASASSNAARSRISSGNALMVDKTRPPMMSLPPPPRAPPPPGSMLPPSFIPERKIVPTSSSAGSSWNDKEMPPPRPSSPPPPELIQRATTPTFGSSLVVPSSGGTGRTGSGSAYRQHGSMPPQAGLRQPVSTSSFRSVTNAVQAVLHPSATISSMKGKEMSTASLFSDRTGMASPRSSMSSEQGPSATRSVQANSQDVGASNNNGQATTTSNKLLGRQVANPTDPAVIHAITQTMIGEFLYKYTRKAIGKGHGTARHRRFFWVHPYTKTLYWSSADPNSTNVAESSAKSAYIEGVRQVLDPNPMPPGLYQYSVVVSTPQREMKFTAPTKERHEIWLNSLKYLLSRPGPTNITSPANTTVTPDNVMSDVEYDDDNDNLGVNSSPSSQRTGRRSTRQETSFNATPRGKRSRSQLSVGGSIGRRAGTPAAEYLRWNAPESPYSPTRSFVDVPGGGDDDELDFELHGDSLSDGGFEGLENVRACCDGRHTVGHSGKHHHHHHHLEGSQNGDHTGSSAVSRPARPVSPSAWSFRSRAGSTHSHEGGGGGGLFSSWGRSDLRFGSKRSIKTNHTQVSQAS
ncbi:hypothetical protein K435DRAFT_774540 [Dendrothele bispora CBS 962.96]|uniref:PH domain-containing protein n=1 Tax=Dendrothele bispora (strain CBS 962.96) TaxID=1314807 RepID=A0A4S8MMQ8_DENBC|nr:hypothetical protein K435DRAFT_774540 [Dendrothele bispora CBS 962.96]